MKYLHKPAKNFDPGYHFSYQKPATCPYCGYGTDATFDEKTVHKLNGNILLTAICKCTSCQRQFFFACEKTKEDIAKNVCLYPAISFQPYSNDRLSSISPRFIDMYNQALRAEFSNDFELAAAGYRSALEILIKDYAINEQGEDIQKVAYKSLFDAIKEYLKQDALINTADVVRILGNDYVHYERKYPQADFAILKKYMEILINQVEMLYMINHPPVSRSK